MWEVEIYAALVQDNFRSSYSTMKQVSEDFLYTDEGLIIFYINPSGQVLEVDTQVDEAMKTVRFNP